MPDNNNILDDFESHERGDKSKEGLSTPLKVVSFCFPIVGTILYFVNKGSAPKKAEDACNMALIGFGAGIVMNVILSVLEG